MANGNPTKKQAIREQFHPQLRELWDTHPSLLALKGRRFVPLEENIGQLHYDHHHSKKIPEAKPVTVARGGQRDVLVDQIDLCEPVIKRGLTFVPLVRERTALRCALKITFLRMEEPGRIYQGGDIDNRLKTLLDALAVPQHDEQVVGNLSPVYCLLEDDSLISGLDIQTHRLLAKPNATKHDVHLLIEVDVRVTDPHGTIRCFWVIDAICGHAPSSVGGDMAAYRLRPGKGIQRFPWFAVPGARWAW